MYRRYKIGLVLLAAVAVGGCSQRGGVSAGSLAAAVSPLSGKWEGKSEVKGGDLDKLANSVSGGPLTGPRSMTLNPDGTGFLEITDKSEQPVSWRQEGDHDILEVRHISDNTNGDHEDHGGPWVGRLSDDNRTMTIEMDKARVILRKQQG